MSYITSKEIFYIDSSHRLNVNNTHTHFQTVLNLDFSVEYDYISLLDMTIPKSAYTINSLNNMFIIEENTVQRNIIIPVGNYSRKSFKNVLQQKLNETPETGYSNYIVSYDSSSNTGDTGKYTYRVTTTESQPSFIFSSGLTDQVGFDSNISYTFINNELISLNVCNFRNNITYYLLSDICQNNNNNILQNIITAGQSDYDYITFQNTKPYEYHKDLVKTIYIYIYTCQRRL